MGSHEVTDPLVLAMGRTGCGDSCMCGGVRDTPEPRRSVGLTAGRTRHWTDNEWLDRIELQMRWHTQSR